MSLLPFILNTAKNTTDTPQSRYFLPDVLASIKGENSQGKLLPIEETRWPIGAISGVPGQTITTAFQNNWMTYLEKVKGISLDGQEAIAQPGSLYPVLVLGGVKNKKIEIIGLQNAYVTAVRVNSFTEKHYLLTISLQFSYWNSSNGQADIPALMIKSPYSMTQNLCLADTESKTCNGNAQTDINGGGDVTVNINNGFVDADICVSVNGSGDSRSLNVDVKKLVLRGTDPGSDPQLDIVNLTINASVSSFLRNIWEESAKKAISSPDGSHGIFSQVGKALNDCNNLSKISDSITRELSALLDELLGQVKGDLPDDQGQRSDNAVDQYIFDRIRYALNDQKSNWYLAKILCNLSDPSIEPYNIKKIDLPDLPVEGITFKNVYFSEVKIKGIANIEALAKTMILYPEKMTLIASLGVLNPVPDIGCKSGTIPLPPSIINGSFNATAETLKLKADFSVTLSSADLNLSTAASGENVDKLVVNIKSMEVSIADLKNMKIDVNIQSAFKGMVNAVVNKPAFKTNIINKINTALSNDLNRISQAVTQYAKTMINEQIS